MQYKEDPILPRATSPEAQVLYSLLTDPDGWVWEESTKVPVTSWSLDNVIRILRRIYGFDIKVESAGWDPERAVTRKRYQIVRRFSREFRMELQAFTAAMEDMWEAASAKEVA